MPPLARLPYLLSHVPGLRGPCPTPGEEVVSRLGLAAGTQPALPRVHLLNSPKVGPQHRVTRQELVVVAGEGLSHLVELGAAEASTRRGPIPSPGSNMLRDPLRRLAGPSLSSDSYRIGQGGLVAVALRCRYIFSRD